MGETNDADEVLFNLLNVRNFHTKMQVLRYLYVYYSLGMSK